MQARFKNALLSSVTVVLLCGMTLTAVVFSQRWSDAMDAPAHTAQSPYAELKWVYLHEVLPVGFAGGEVKVPLIVIDGAVLLPSDHEE